MTEPASVVAARQLAQEARARRGGVECAPSAVPGRQEQRSLRTRRIRAALVASAALTTAGCVGGLGQACPAIGYGSAVVVQLDGWPAGAGRDAELTCAECGRPDNGIPGTAQTLPIGTQVRVTLQGAPPDEVTVRVLEEGAVVAELTAEPEFVRVDGTEECGGTTEAVVVVPAP